MNMALCHIKLYTLDDEDASPDYVGPVKTSEMIALGNGGSNWKLMGSLSGHLILGH